MFVQFKQIGWRLPDITPAPLQVCLLGFVRPGIDEAHVSVEQRATSELFAKPLIAIALLRAGASLLRNMKNHG